MAQHRRRTKDAAEHPAPQLLMKLYSYIVRRDFGFAPNPFFGVCTLATCKPKIREHCQDGDWVIGTGSAEEGRPGHLIYIMRVREVVSLDDYWSDPRFLKKRPNLRGSLKLAFGDNIYSRSSEGAPWRQLPSHHSLPDGSANPANVNPDTNVNRVLVSDKFIYWGSRAPEIPSDFREPEDICCKSQGHKCRFSPALVKAFVHWVCSGDTSWGLHGEPQRWEMCNLIGDRS